MKYMIRETFTAQRGKVPEYLESLKVIIGVLKSVGYTEHRLMVDISHNMDTVYHEYEVDSIDKYFELERGFFVNPDADTRRLIDNINNLTVSGHREIYEIIE